MNQVYLECTGRIPLYQLMDINVFEPYCEDLHKVLNDQ